jgi:hypothetical protein
MIDKSNVGDKVAEVEKEMKLKREDESLTFERGEKLELIAYDEEAEREGKQTTVYTIGRDEDESFRISNEQIQDLDIIELIK